MNKRKFAAALAAVSILMTMSACSKNRQEHTELPDEHSVVLTPNYNEGESEYEYGKSESSEESSFRSRAGKAPQKRKAALLPPLTKARKVSTAKSKAPMTSLFLLTQRTIFRTIIR